MKQVLETHENATVPEDIARSWYRKSHTHYEPSEQIIRDYKEPFDKFAIFGKLPKRWRSESRVNKILTWINHEPLTLVNRQQADFIECTSSSVGQIKDPKTSRLHADAVHGKKYIKDEFDVSDALRDFDLDKQTVFWWQCLQDLSSFRRKLQKRVPEVCFSDIEDEFSCLDKKYVGVLPEDKIYETFEKYRICPNKEFLAPLMDTLQLRKDGNVNYRELLNLFNWRRSMPVLPKMKQAPLANLDYITTYGETIGNVQTADHEKIRTAGLPSERTDFLMTRLPCAGIYPDKENLGDQTSMHCLISPSIFTRYGLTHIDFFKTRDKEEIRSIFENIGFEFPDRSFNELWKKGLRKDCTGGVCVETFRELLDASGFVAKEVKCE